MPAEADTSAEAGCFLSVRSSCDRCRVQKLKCSVLSGSGACERCTRAKLPCVFGRRTRSKRMSGSDEGQIRPTVSRRNTSPVAQAMPLTPFTSASATPLPTNTSSMSTTTSMAMPPPVAILAPSTMAAQGEYLTQSGPYMRLAGPVGSAGSDTEPDYHYTRSWDNLVLLQDSFTDVMEKNCNMGNYGGTQFAFDVSDVVMFDGGQVDPPRCLSQQGNLTATNSRPIDIPCTATGSKIGGHGLGNTAVLTSQQLITLISEIQQRLRNLEESEWHAGSARSLDDYPIGSVLQLSHQFSSIARSALSTSRIASGVGAPALDDENGRAMAIEGSSSEGSTSTKDEDQDERKANGAVLDTPTILLLLSGYLWLARIFDIVLGHFQKHLNQMPSRYDHGGGANSSSRSSSSSSSSSNAVVGRTTLRLGELSWANGALDLQKIHIAVSMLLDELHDVEAQMGRGGGVVRDLAVALLLNNPTRPGGDDGWHCDGLGKRMTGLKELLREKMGL